MRNPGTPAEVEVWYVDLARLDVDQGRCEALLDEYERETALKFKFQHLQDRYVIVHGLLRRVLANYLAVQPKQLKISRTEFGKPYLPDYPHIAFNISHSASELVIAVGSEVTLGVDIEVVKSRQNFEGIVDRCFSTREQAYWHALPEAQKTGMFYRFWTRKEAFVKAVGRGIGLGLEQCELALDKQGCFLTIPADCGAADEWRVFDIEVGESSRAALVVQAGHVVLKLRLLDQGFQI